MAKNNNKPANALVSDYLTEQLMKNTTPFKIGMYVMIFVIMGWGCGLILYAFFSVMTGSSAVPAYLKILEAIKTANEYSWILLISSALGILNLYLYLKEFYKRKVSAEYMFSEVTNDNLKRTLYGRSEKRIALFAKYDREAFYLEILHNIKGFFTPFIIVFVVNPIYDIAYTQFSAYALGADIGEAIKNTILNSYAFALASIVIATKIMKIVMGKILIERIDKIWEKFNKKQLDK